MSVARPSHTATSCNDAWAVLYPMEVDRQEGHSCYYKALMGLCSSFRGVCARSCKECTVTEEFSSPSSSWWKTLVAPSPPSPSPTPTPPPSPPSPKPRLPPPLPLAWSPYSPPASGAAPSPMLGSFLAPMLQGMRPSTQTHAAQLHEPALPSTDELRTCELRTTYKVVEWGDYGRRAKVALEVHPWVAGALVRLAYGAPLRIPPYDVSGGVIAETGPETVDFILLADAPGHALFFWLDGRDEKPTSIGCELNSPSSHASAASKPSSPPAFLALLPQSSSGLKAACPLGPRVSVLGIQDSGPKSSIVTTSVTGLQATISFASTVVAITAEAFSIFTRKMASTSRPSARAPSILAVAVVGAC
ncbi:hypothetical protein AB1Y20_020184 [Prymnesium parvum]|uniref:Uncharacterized protein n=1 Tax=Prymnesium parvum TaxID=97485 RepID=A0AB34JWK8_PRYPA